MTTYDPEFFDTYLDDYGEPHPDDIDRWNAVYEETMQREAEEAEYEKYLRDENK